MTVNLTDLLNGEDRETVKTLAREKSIEDVYGILTGSNANGNYVKFPDGTLIQEGSASQQTSFVASGSIYQSATGQKFTFPIAFISNPLPFGEALGATAIWCGTRVVSTTNFEIVDFQASSANSNISRQWIAIGKWK